jgi:3-hydroxyisobutyrate dehydrogenase-like beta-hydroxyacid dehydrogenase
VKANLTKIGFIGLGNMGSPMARNVLAKVITARRFQFKLQYFIRLKADTGPALWCHIIKVCGNTVM